MIEPKPIPLALCLFVLATAAYFNFAWDAYDEVAYQLEPRP